jgi:predicted dehydrogenase
MNAEYPAVKTALIGVSGYGGSHLKGLLALEEKGEVKISAATVINRQEEQEKCAALEANGCRIYGDYREMLEEEAGALDLCVIPTGIAWHCPMTLAALEKGCHVLVEKPVAGSLEEVDEMIAGRDLADRQVAVGFHHLYTDQYFALKKAVCAGEIGRLREIRVRAAWPRPTKYYARNDWAGRLRSKGRLVLDSPANNAFAHFLMAALHLAGPSPYEAASPVELQAELYRTQEIESFDTISARVRVDSGVTILFSVTHCSLANEDPVIELVGDGGVICWEVDKTLSTRRAGVAAIHDPLPPSSLSKFAIFGRVLSQIRGSVPEACRLEEARKHTFLINALHRHVPILDVPAAFRISKETECGTQHAIKDINETLLRGFREGRLFSELDTPWSQPAHSAGLETPLPPSPARLELEASAVEVSD